MIRNKVLLYKALFTVQHKMIRILNNIKILPCYLFRLTVQVSS